MIILNFFSPIEGAPSNKVCFGDLDVQSPLFLGKDNSGNIAITVINANGYDIIFGGPLTSNNFFVGLYSMNDISWAKEIANNINQYKPTGLTGLSYSLQANYIIIGTFNTTSFVVVNASTGDLKSQGYLASSATNDVFAGSNSLILDDRISGKERIYITYQIISTTSYGAAAFYMNYTRIWYAQINKKTQETSSGRSLYLPLTQGFLLVGGQYYNNPDTYAALFYINSTDGTLMNQFYLTASNTKYYVSQITLDGTTSYSCLDDSSNYLNLAYLGIFTYDSATQKTNAFNYEVGSNMQSQCLSIKGVTNSSGNLLSLSVGFRTADTSNLYFYSIGTINFSVSTSMSVVSYPFYNKNAAYFQSIVVGSMFYYAGTFQNYFLEGLSYSKQHGFIMNMKQAVLEQCPSSDTKANQTLTLKNLTIKSSGPVPQYNVSYSVTTMPTTFTLALSDSKVVINANKNSSTCNLYQYIYFSLSPIISNVTLDVRDYADPITATTIKSFNISNSLNCVDATYQVTIKCGANGQQNCPNWIDSNVVTTALNLTYVSPTVTQTVKVALTISSKQMQQISTTMNYQVDVLDRCNQKVVTNPTISNIQYRVKDGLIQYNHLNFTSSPSYCIENFTYTAQYQNGSALPSFINYNSLTKNFTIETYTNTSAGLHPVQVKLQSNKNTSEFYLSNFTINITEYNWCLDLTINLSSSPVNQTYTVLSPQLDYTHPQLIGNYSWCMDQYYTIMQTNGSSLMSFVTYNNLTGLLSIYSDNNITGGYYELNVSKNNVSFIFSITVIQFDYCTIQQLTYPTIANYNYTVNDAQYSFSFNNITSNYSYCLDGYQFQATLDTMQPLPSFINFNSSTNNFEITTIDNNNIGSYNILLQYLKVTALRLLGASPIYNITWTLNVFYYDFCATKQITFDQIANQVYVVHSNQLNVSFNKFYSNPSFCLDNYTYKAILNDGSNLPSFMTLSMSALDNQIQVQTDNNTNVGNYSITIRVENNTGNFYDNNFTLEIQYFDYCTIQNVTGPLDLKNNVYSSLSYKVHDPAKTLTHNLFTTDYAGCLDNYTYDAVWVTTLENPLPNFITYNPNNQTFTFQTENNSYSGVYYTIQVFIKYGTKRFDAAIFQIYVEYFDFCSLQNLISPSITNQTYMINTGNFKISHDPFISNISGCLDGLSYSSTFQNGSQLDANFITYSQADSAYYVNTINNSYAGTYQINLTLGNASVSYSIIWFLIINTFDYCTIDIVTSPISKSWTYQVTQANTSYGYDLFVTNTSGCLDGFVYDAQLQNGSSLPTFIQLSPNQSSFYVYSNVNSSAGNYNIRLFITKDAEVYDQNFTLTIQEFDFCQTQTISSPALVNQTYYVHNTQITYTHDIFTSDYSYCLTSYYYQSKLSNANDLPSFITYDNSTKQFTILSDTNNDVGIYDVDILIYNDTQQLKSATFSVTVIAFDFCTIKNVSIPNNLPNPGFTYRVNQTEKEFSHNDFTSDAANCLQNFSYYATLQNGSALPSFITYLSSNRTFQVYSNTNDDVGTYQLTVYIQNPDASQIYTASFELYIQSFDFCTIKQVQVPYLGDYSYQVHSPTLFITHDPFVSDPDGCLAGYNTNVTYNGSSVTPAFISYDQVARKFSVQSEDNSNEGIVAIQIVITDGIDSYQFTFNLDISTFDFCIFKTVQIPTVTFQLYTVHSPIVSYELGSYILSPANCFQNFVLTITYDGQLTPSCGNCINFSAPRRVFDIFSESNSDAGTYNVQVSLTDGNEAYTVSFPITIYTFDWCTIKIVTKPTISNVVYTVNQNMIDFVHDAYTVDQSGCLDNFTLSAMLQDGSNLPSFITYDNSTQNFSIYSIDNAFANTYNVRLSLTYLTESYDVDFTVTINYFDFCTIKNVTAPTISDANYTVHDSTLVLAHQNFTADYSNCFTGFTQIGLLEDNSTLPSFISYDSSSNSFSIQTNSNSDVNEYHVKVRTYKGSEIYETLPFKLKILYFDYCTIQIVTPPTITSPQNYTINDPLKQISHGFFTTNQLGCITSFSYSATYQNGSALPSFITYLPQPDYRFEVRSISNSDVGIYPLRLQITDGSTTYYSNFSLEVQYFDFCTIQTIVPPTINPISYSIKDPSLSISHSDFSSDYSYCLNNFSYSLSLQNGSAQPSFISYSSPTFTFYSSDPSVQATYPLSLSYSDGTISYYVNFTLFMNPEGYCTNKTITSPVFINQTYTVYDSALIYTHDPFTSDPSTCILMYTYKAVQMDDSALPNFIQYDSNAKQFTVQTNYNELAGTYYIKVQVTYFTETFDSDILEIKVFALDCSSQSLTVTPSLADQTYQVYSAAKTITHPLFQGTPANCFLNYTYSSSLDNNTNLPSIISYNPSTNIYSIYAFDNFTEGLLNLRVKYSYPSSPTSQPSYYFDFKLTIVPFDFCILKTVYEPTITGSPLKIKVKSSSYSFIHNAFTSNPEWCLDNFTLRSELANGNILPSFIQYDKNNSKYTIQTNDNNDVGVYNISLILTDNATEVYYSFWELEILLYEQCTTKSVVKSLINSTAYYINYPIMYIIHDSFTSNISGCLDNFTYGAQLQNGNPLDTSVINYDQNGHKFSIFTNDVTKAGNYDIRLFLNDSSNNEYYYTDFRIQIIDQDPCISKIVTKPAIVNISYDLEDPSLVYKHNLFTSSPVLCLQSYTYSASLQNDQPLPRFITYDPLLQQFEIYTSNQSDIGWYLIKVSLSSLQDNYSFIFGISINKKAFCDNPKVYLPKLQDQTYIVYQTSQFYTHNPFSTYPYSCILNYDVSTSQRDGSNLMSFMNYDALTRTYSVKTDNNSNAGTYYIRLKLTERQNGTLYYVDWKLTVSPLDCTNKQVRKPYIPNMQYNLGGPLLFYQHDQFSGTPSVCFDSYTYKTELSDGSSLPDFIQYNDKMVQYDVQMVKNTTGRMLATDSSQYQGNYSVRVSFYYGSEEFYVDFLISVVQLPPTQQPATQTVYQASQVTPYYSGIQVSNQDDSNSLQIVEQNSNIRTWANLGNASSIAFYQDGVLHFDTSSLNESANYTIEVTVIDSTTGKPVRINLQLPFNIVVDKTIKYQEKITGYIDTINNKGVVTIEFSDKIKNILGLKDKENPSGFKARVIPGNSNYNREKMNYTIEAFTVKQQKGYQMIVNLTFAQPSLIGSSIDFDKLEIEYLQNELIQSLDGRLRIKKGYIMQKWLPQQYSGSDDQLEQISDVVGQFLQSTIVAGVGSALLFGIPMKELWKMLINLQILTHMPAFNVGIPTNYLAFMKFLVKCSSMDILPIKPYINQKIANLQNSAKEANPRTQNSQVEIAQTGISSFILTLTFVAPVLVYYFFKKYQKRLKENSFKLKFDSLYKDLDTKRFLNLMQIEIFMIRRLMMAFSIIFLTKYPFLQVFFNLAFSFLYLFYLLALKPIAKKMNFYVEVFNESIIFLVSAGMYAFLDIIDDMEYKRRIGQYLIFLVCALLIINLLLWGFKLCQNVYGLFKKLLTTLEECCCMSEKKKKKKEQEKQKKTIKSKIGEAIKGYMKKDKDKTVKLQAVNLDDEKSTRAKFMDTMKQPQKKSFMTDISIDIQDNDLSMQSQQTMIERSYQSQYSNHYQPQVQFEKPGETENLSPSKEMLFKKYIQRMVAPKPISIQNTPNPANIQNATRPINYKKPDQNVLKDYDDEIDDHRSQKVDVSLLREFLEQEGIPKNMENFLKYQTFGIYNTKQNH